MPMTRRLVFLTLACGMFRAGAAPAGVPDDGLERFCTPVQQVLAATGRPSRNVVYAELEAFVLSKASIRPLVTRQYVHTDDAGRPRMISCKVKTADILRYEYGPDAAGHEGQCESINRLTLERLTAGRATGERVADTRGFGVFSGVVLERDDVGVSGVNWLKPYTMLWQEGGVLHIQSKALRVDWGDKRFTKAPARFRGTHYCHLVAPSYLRRVLDGEVVVPARDM